jgi:molecular chaperone GrpE
MTRKTEKKYELANATDAADALRDQPAAERSAAEEQAVPDSAEALETGALANAVEAEIAALEARVAELEAKCADAENRYLRCLADFQNYRRRAEEQRSEIAQFANREFIIGLLPVLDNFERAVAAANQAQSVEAFADGVTLILRQLTDLLQKAGVTRIEALGQQFDPNFHEAVERIHDGGHPENTIVEEVQPGYVMQGRVLRPSMVKVALPE